MKNEKSHDVSESRNLSRFSVENPHITWVLLIGTVIWGLYGYLKMPQRKDPISR
jgi:multidrug efflux pump subunit AcrB